MTEKILLKVQNGSLPFHHYPCDCNLFRYLMKIKLCSFYKALSNLTTEVSNISTVPSSRSSQSQNISTITDKEDDFMSSPSPSSVLPSSRPSQSQNISTITDKEDDFMSSPNPSSFLSTSHSPNHNISLCVCDVETLLKNTNVWVFVGVGAGLIVAIAFSVILCCW